MADKKKMTVAEMIAAARKADSKGGEEASAPPPADEAAAAAPAEESAQSAPAPAKAAPAKDAKKMSVAEMLAAARAEKSAPKPTAAKPAEAKAVEAKPAAAKPAAKPAAAKSETSPASPSTEKDTASILAAIRKTAKPGPVSKSAAPAETKPAGKPKIPVPPMPEKPAYARPRPVTAAATDRRGFFATGAGVLLGSWLAIGFTSLAVTNLLWVLGLARFMFPNVLIEPPTKFRVGFVDDFAPGQVSEKYKAQFGVWIVRYEWEGQPMIYALKTVCTHLGCTPNWLEGEQKFKCPCHGSGFYKDGVNFEGPAPRPLERYGISKVDGQLQVDKSATYHEETGQWADPASFVLT